MNQDVIRNRGLCALMLCALASAATTQAATGDVGTVTLTPNTDETAMELKWVFPDDFSPFGECNASFDFSVSVDLDGTVVGGPWNNGNYTLSRDANEGGNCVLRRTFVSGAVYTNKISPGTWRATASIAGYAPLGELRTIFACTATQGKQPMYWVRNASLTDNFYTVSIAERDAALGIGYRDRGVPFAMPNRVRFGSQPFWRYYKGAPQFEHFYSTSNADNAVLSANGYAYEGIEGFVFKDSKPGTIALRRFVAFNSTNSDLQHLYTINRNDPSAYGMTYEGIVGYVCRP